MARTKAEQNLARDTWMRLYKQGTPVDVRHTILGQLVIRHEPYEFGNDEVKNPDWDHDDYYPLVITGDNKTAKRCSVDGGNGHFGTPGVPLQHGTMVVVLNPFKLSEN